MPHVGQDSQTVFLHIIWEQMAFPLEDVPVETKTNPQLSDEALNDNSEDQVDQKTHLNCSTQPRVALTCGWLFCLMTSSWKALNLQESVRMSFC